MILNAGLSFLVVRFVPCILLERTKKSRAGEKKKSEITPIYDGCYLTFNKISANLRQAVRDGFFFPKYNEKR